MDLIGIVVKESFDLEGSPRSIQAFYNFRSVWFWFYLDVGFNCTEDFKFGVWSILVPLLSMRSSSLFDKNLEDWCCKLKVIQDMPKILI